MQQDSVLIDLVDFKHLSYDEATDISEAIPGTVGTELLEYLQSKVRFVPGGHCATIALGGIPYTRVHGPGCKGKPLFRRMLFRTY